MTTLVFECVIAPGGGVTIVASIPGRESTVTRRWAPQDAPGDPAAFMGELLGQWWAMAGGAQEALLRAPSWWSSPPKGLPSDADSPADR